MKHHFTFVLVHKELDRDNTYIQFRGSDYQARKAYDSLSFALCHSPYCKLLLLSGNSVCRETFLKGAF